MTAPPYPEGRTGRWPPSRRATWAGSAVLTTALFALSWPKYLDHTYWAEDPLLEVGYGVVAYVMAVYVVVVFVRAITERSAEEA